MDTLQELVKICDRREYRLEISYAVRQRRKKTPWAGRIKGGYRPLVMIEEWGSDPLDVVTKLLGRVALVK